MDKEKIKCRSVKGYLISRIGKKNIMFNITFSKNTTTVKFEKTTIIFHHYFPERNNNDEILGFEMFNAWLRNTEEIGYIRMLSAARIAGVEYFSE